MPLVKKDQPLPERPVIIFIFGDPGTGKTSLANTANEPLLVDADRGVDRSINRTDAVIIRSWEDVQSEEQAGTFKGYKTVTIDTAKAMLDDFLMSYVVKKDMKNAKNKMAAYGAIGDEFKLFVNNRRTEQADIVIIAHAKEDKEGETIKKYPDVTGQSYGLLLRIADQVGYLSIRNGKRVLQFEPTETVVGKNVARIPALEIPNESEPEFKTFMATIVDRVRKAISTMSEEQVKDLKAKEELQLKIEACEDPAVLTDLLKEVSTQPNHIKLSLQKLIMARAKAKGWKSNKEAQRFEVEVKEEAKKELVSPGNQPEQLFQPTPQEERIKLFEKAGAILGSDGVVYGEIGYTYEEIEKMTEDQFAEALGKIKQIKKAEAKKK